MTQLRLAIIAVCLALLAAGGLTWYITQKPGANAVTSQVDPDAQQIGGPFSLLDQDGKRVDDSILKGKWTAIFFGYTYCPDICPLTLQSLARTQAALGKDGDKLQIVFVTVDPARDTPENMKAYLSSGGFPKGVIGLTGTPDEIKKILAEYRVLATKVGEGDNYTYNHTSLVYLMNPDGQFDSPIMADLTPQQSADQIRDAMKGK
ncbi:MAG: SCO family protein [Asticcacaulis sp.]